MIELKNAFKTTQLNRVKSGEYFRKGLDCQYLFKFKDRNNVRYHIIIDKYENNVNFVKFYRIRQENLKGSKKYQFRDKNPKQEFSRIIATCVDVCLKIKKKDENSIFAFYGQWDETDILKGKTRSQRIRIYSRALKSICDTEKYKIASNEILNYIVLMPLNRYKENLEHTLYTQFYNWTGEKNLMSLQVPKNVKSKTKFATS